MPTGGSHATEFLEGYSRRVREKWIDWVWLVFLGEVYVLVVGAILFLILQPASVFFWLFALVYMVSVIFTIWIAITPPTRLLAEPCILGTPFRLRVARVGSVVGAIVNIPLVGFFGFASISVLIAYLPVPVFQGKGIGLFAAVLLLIAAVASGVAAYVFFALFDRFTTLKTINEDRASIDEVLDLTTRFSRIREGTTDPSVRLQEMDAALLSFEVTPTSARHYPGLKEWHSRLPPGIFLDERTEKFLLTAEYLRERYRGMQGSSVGRLDTSPVLLEYGKAFESEVKAKLFEGFLKGESGPFKKWLQGLVSLKEMIRNDSKFNSETRAKVADLCNRLAQLLTREPGEVRSEIGKMRLAIQRSLGCPGALLKEYPESRDYFDFLARNFKQPELDTFVGREKTPEEDSGPIPDVEGWRNRAAHTGDHGLDDVDKCRDAVSESLGIFLSTMKPREELASLH